MEMHSFKGVIQVFLILMVFITVYSQRIIFGDYEERSSRRNPSPSNCGRFSCIPISRCASLRSQRNWRNVGQTCGYGPGALRRVCCPRRGGTYISTRPPWIPITEPLPTAPSPIYVYLPPRPDINPFPSRPNIVPRLTSPEEMSMTPRPNPRPDNNNNNNAECGQPNLLYQAYVMGGENASEGAWPWMVAITRRERNGLYTPWCTGFLIDRIHVLSAAHCFDGRMETGLYSTRIGRVNQNEGEVYPIDRIQMHEGYRRNMYYDDIAIITLTRQVDTPNVVPICLPDAYVSSMNLEGTGTTVAGWGSERVGGPLSIILKQLKELPIVSNQNCNRILRDRSRGFRRQFPQGITNNFICAGFPEGEKDACGGDSGGPLMLMENNRWYAIGIVSFGYSCGLPGIPGGYTRISSYLDWIQANTRN